MQKITNCKISKDTKYYKIPNTKNAKIQNTKANTPTQTT